MHRSGTSMVAGLLKLCGLHMGENLLSHLADNPKGHFEDRDFLRINARIFEANASQWGAPPERLTNIPQSIHREMTAFLHKWPKDIPVGWKDPRACLTIKLWQQKIQPEELKVVVVLRPALQIARSLKKRNKFPFEKSFALTDLYLRKLIHNLEGIPYCTTDFNSYFDDWQKPLKEVCSFLDLGIPKRTGPITRFIEPKLWHHRRLK